MEIKKLNDGSYEVQCKSRLHIIGNDDGSFTVESESGHTYTVTHWSPEFEEDVHVWKCDCPAAQHGRDCKHVTAVATISAAIEDGNDELWTVDD